MASKNKAAKSATKSHVDQMNELTLSDGVKNQEEEKKYIENGNNQ